MQHGLLSPLYSYDKFLNILQSIKNGHKDNWADGTIAAQRWHFTAGLLYELKRPALIIASSEIRAKEIYEDMSYFFDVQFFPSRDMLFYAADVKSFDITRERLKILIKNKTITQQACSLGSAIVILSAEALLDRMTPPDIFFKYTLELSTGDTIEMQDLIKKLSLLGFERRSIIEGPGQFALRGGILDIYPVTNDNAIRIEFFDNEIDSIRIIDPLSQRSIEKIGLFELYPVRELVFDKDTLKRAKEKIKQETEDIMDIEHNPDAFLPFFYEEKCCLLDYISKDSIIIFDEPNDIRTHIDTLYTEYSESVSHRLMAGRILPTQAHVLITWEDVLHKTQDFTRLIFTNMAYKLKDFDIDKPISINAKSCMPLRRKPDELATDLNDWLKKDYTLVILAGTKRHGQLLLEAFTDMGLGVRLVDDIADSHAPARIITISRGAMTAGFEYPDIKLVVITDKELFKTEKRRKNRRTKNAQIINHFTDLRVGDYIVHDNHGIGIFRGIEQVTTDNMSRDYLKIEYKNGGNLYISTTQMDFIQRYIGSKEEVKLSKLGGADWIKAKSRAREAIEILAKDLIDIYAKRQAAVGYVYGPDTVWQSEFEAQFPYQETDDQLAAIEDVKRDMETDKVMDRLICGDVGYGKTEIAIRAAFKAVQDNKQVAYLVPTTILAQQHYYTFSSRMRDYPIKVDRLSRFQSKKEQQETLKNLEKGMVDIVIGTHRLLSKDVNFKNLGLIIVDEEQRFGVGHKEKLKAISANIDVLTLTATPIPRTLHFSLTGIRDMSILDEPPEERQPIQTYVMESNSEFVRDAINRELARGGQVYYLHNRVRNISEEAARVQALVPQARVAFGHGQMSEIELENIMNDFVEGEIDVLVCTTIIETGLDIPNVNTIIIQNADFMGLAQLYQLRGRVGRSSRIAYAYLMYRRDKVLKEEAQKRLQTIRDFTEFGAGFKIAMRDLEIRGAGNLLGAKQHGHMDLVGYDMYCKLLAEAVADLQGKPIETKSETTIDIKIDAFIPDNYIPDEQQKLEIYKKISVINNKADLDDIEDEILDRFGDPPKVVQNLLNIAIFKARINKLGCISINEKGDNLIITFKPEASVNMDKLTAILKKNPGRILFTAAANPYITMRNIKRKKDNDGSYKITLLEKLFNTL